MSQEVIKGTSAKKLEDQLNKSSITTTVKKKKSRDSRPSPQQILSYGCVKKLDSPSREEQARLAGKEAQYFSTHRFKLEVGRDLLAGNSS